KEEKSLSELASHHGIHVNQLPQWKKAVLEQLPQLFTKENKKQDLLISNYEDQIQNLYAEVGKLTTHLSWLKKKAGIKD
ncbi:transposase, partial [Bacillus sp. EB600]|uniref:transposase n=1 Tax=Bacillus sp. EB600 TaxID=2806345 RepID=UPI0035C26665|nr:IS3 family transposase [Bacillus sp. EB600]